MRLLLAGGLVFGGVLLAVGLLSAFPAAPPAWAIAAVALSVGGGLTFLTLRFLNRPGPAGDPVDPATLASEGFQARRAFQASEFEDEGSHYFLELEDGRVLYLTGQYLYDYEPLEPGEARRFPCTEFTVRRHGTEGWAYDILCGGRVLEPECVVPAVDPSALKDIPEDGQVIADRSYDALKQAMQARR